MSQVPLVTDMDGAQCKPLRYNTEDAILPNLPIRFFRWQPCGIDTQRIQYEIGRYPEFSDRSGFMRDCFLIE